MTTIDVDTSPLEAAREWRGIGIVAAARTCGLHVAQAEALECGDLAAFASVDEMIAAAVVYGSSLGIGRDEAMALLDRTVSGRSVNVQVPDVPDDREADGFSTAVRERSARIAGRSIAVDASAGALQIDPGAAAALDEPVAPSLRHEPLPAIPDGPTPEQAVAASTEIELDSMFGPEVAPWDGTGHTGELEAWVSESDHDMDGSTRPARTMPALLVRGGEGAHAALERLVGTERADQAADFTVRAVDRTSVFVRDARERLRRSEHATLIVAIVAGAVLVALLVAIGGALGGDSPSQQAATTRTPAAQAPVADQSAAPEKAAPAKAKPQPMLAPGRMTVDVFNAGRRQGYAKQLAAKLKDAGYRIGNVTNAKGDYNAAVVLHPKGRGREGRVLARKLGIGSVAQAPGDSTRFVVVGV